MDTTNRPNDDRAEAFMIQPVPPPRPFLFPGEYANRKGRVAPTDGKIPLIYDTNSGRMYMEVEWPSPSSSSTLFPSSPMLATRTTAITTTTTPAAIIPPPLSSVVVPESPSVIKRSNNAVGCQPTMSSTDRLLSERDPFSQQSLSLTTTQTAIMPPSQVTESPLTRNRINGGQPTHLLSQGDPFRQEPSPSFLTGTPGLIRPQQTAAQMMESSAKRTSPAAEQDIRNRLIALTTTITSPALADRGEKKEEEKDNVVTGADDNKDAIDVKQEGGSDQEADDIKVLFAHTPHKYVKSEPVTPSMSARTASSNISSRPRYDASCTPTVRTLPSVTTASASSTPSNGGAVRNGAAADSHAEFEGIWPKLLNLIKNSRFRRLMDHTVGTTCHFPNCNKEIRGADAKPQAVYYHVSSHHSSGGVHRCLHCGFVGLRLPEHNSRRHRGKPVRTQLIRPEIGDELIRLLALCFPMFLQNDGGGKKTLAKPKSSKAAKEAAPAAGSTKSVVASASSPAAAVMAAKNSRPSLKGVEAAAASSSGVMQLIHSESAKGNREIKCRFKRCTKKIGLKSADTVTNHLLVHMKEKRYECRECGEKVASKKFHYKLHTGKATTYVDRSETVLQHNIYEMLQQCF